MVKDKILIIDFGGQYAHLISRRIRDLGVYTEITYPESLPDNGYKGYVLSGGPSSVYVEKHDHIVESIIEKGKPLLGICYGHQLLAKVLGGKVGPSPSPEFGPVRVEVKDGHPITRGLAGKRLRVWMSHNDAVLSPPPGARVHASTRGSPVAMFTLGGNIIGVQWHPEVRHSELGSVLLDNFIKITGSRREWNIEMMLEEIRRYIRGKLKPGSKAVAAVSGGIDSSLATYLVIKYSNADVIPVFIDTGLLPWGEREKAVKLLDKIGVKPIILEKSRVFLGSLKGIEDPEEKRLIVGQVYSEVLSEFSREIGATHLIQGTIYPDVIESVANPGADTIKTHHNVGGLRVHGLVLVEPLRNLYKDEVRRIALSLGFPEELVYKKPIPGPGLAVRVEGPVDEERLNVARTADRIFREIVEEKGLDRNLWQYFAVLTRSKATGVKGDKRSYGFVVVLRAVTSSDAMTADVAELPYDVLREAARRIIGSLPQVTRVLYDVTTKPPATIEWE